jgi:hypothetical protein
VAASFVPQVALAQTSYLVLPLRGNAFSSTVGDTLIDVRTEAQLATSTSVLQQVALQSPFTVDQLRRRTTVGQLDATRVVLVTFRGRTPAEAAEHAILITQAALSERVTRADEARQAEVEDLTAQTQSAQAALLDVLRSTEPEARDVRVLSQRVNALSQQIQLIDATAPSPGYQVSTSDVQADANRPVRIGVILAGSLAGALAGLVWQRRRGRGRLRASLRGSRVPGAGAVRRRLPSGRAS